MSLKMEKKDEWDELAEVIDLFKQSPPPLPYQYKFGTPSPEDALIEAIDNNKREKNEED